MICFPNAKINIGLNITEKRSDGFHNIETILYPLNGVLVDALEVIKSTKLSFQSSGIKIPGNKNDNLCLKAYNLIKQDYPQVPEVNVYLHKAIPIGAGLGGGSADGAFFIKLINEAFELGISWGEMHHYARQLGSDCSFFVTNKPSYASGKGDVLESININLSEYYVALIYPNIHINTTEAYRGIIPKKSVRSLEDDILKLPISSWKKYIHNDFEESIFPKYPVLKSIKEKLYSKGALYASMSGSGSALFGIFKALPDVKNDFKNLKSWTGKLT